MNPRAPRIRPLAAALSLLLLPALAAGAPRAAQAGAAEPGTAQPPAEGAGAGAQRVLQLTLEDALRIALQRNLGLEAEILATEIAQEDALGSWGSFDPVLNVVGTASQQERQGSSQLSGATVIEDDQLKLDASLRVPIQTGGDVSLSFSRNNAKTNNQFATFDVSTTDVLTLAVTQPLLKGGWSRYATSLQRTREIDLENQKQRERQVRQQLLLDVYGAYWDLVSAIEELNVRNLAVERADKQLEQDRRRLDLGAGTEVDVLQSRTTRAQQAERLLNARFLLRQAEDTLRHLLFQELEGSVQEYLDEWDWPIEPLTSLPGVSPVDTDWRRSLQMAIQQRPELWQRRLEIDRSALNLDLAESDWLPQLDLNLSTSSAGFDADPDESLQTAIDYEFPSSSASLDFTLPLLNRAGRHGVRSARSAYRRAQLNFDQTELDILSEVRAAVRDVQYRAEAVAAAEQSAALAQRQLEAEQLRMEIGSSTTFQVLEFQETLAEARSTEVGARAAYAKALVKLRHAEGALEPAPSEAEANAGDGQGE